LKYASEVIDLLTTYPGTEFKMAQIVRHVTRARDLSPGKRNAVRIGVFRVLEQLRDSGQVQQSKEGATSATYAWRPELLHGIGANCHANCNNIGSRIAS